MMYMLANMSSIPESTELLSYLRTGSGRDLLAALPLISSHIVSAATIDILRRSAASVLADAERELGLPICLIAFGSLGRLEFASDVSDLDPIIVIEGSCSRSLAARARALVLTPMAIGNPWLTLDHRDMVVRNEWSTISNPDIPYPVIGIDDLTGSPEPGLASQRRWQILLEGRAIFNGGLFDRAYERLLPRLKRTRLGMADDLSDSQERIDFRTLTSGAADHFGAYDNPAFLYKDQFKYFKTRFLRDFFVFATQLLFFVGMYRQRFGEKLSLTYLRAATVTKILRTMHFADELALECKNCSGFDSICSAEISARLQRYQISEPSLLSFSTDYASLAPRLLRGLLMRILTLYVECWQQIHDPRVRTALEALPKAFNFESSFQQSIPDVSTRQIVEELLQRRNSYRKYIAATASVVGEVFPAHRVYGPNTVPGWIRDALLPFTTMPTRYVTT